MNIKLPQVLAVLLFVVGCGAKTDSQTAGTSGGNSNWLRACDEDADCEDEDACIHEVCLAPCDAIAACLELSEDAQCAPVSLATTGAASVCETEATSFCVLGCNDDEDCAAMGSAYQCAEGTCAASCESSEPAANDAGEMCVAAIDSSGCCLPVIATTLAALAADPCLVLAEGADPQAVWDQRGACAVPEPCPGASCESWGERPDFDAVAVAGEGGACELRLPL
jgi:hypothetical protein